MSWMLLDVIALSNVGTSSGNNVTTIVYENGLSPVDSVIIEIENPSMEVDIKSEPLIVVFETPQELILILPDMPEE